jgi:transposase
MSRTFKKVDYDQAFDLTVRLGDCLPPDHLARFVVDSVAQLDLSALYANSGSRGGEPYAPRNVAELAALRVCHRGVEYRARLSARRMSQ